MKIYQFKLQSNLVISNSDKSYHRISLGKNLVPSYKLTP